MHQATEIADDSDRFNRDKVKRVINTAGQTLLWFFAAAVLLQNVSLQKQNKGMRETQSTMVTKDVLLKALAPPIDVGRQIRDVRGAGLDQAFRVIPLVNGGRPGTVIITFSPGCINCVHNQVGWAALADGLASLGWQVIWVSRDALDVTLRYSKLHAIDQSNILSDPTYNTYRQLGLAAVPNTLVVDGQGVVRKVWIGQLGGSWPEVFAYFKMSPPSPLVSLDGKLN